MQKVCGWECGLVVARAKAEKEAKRRHKADKARVKTMGEVLRETQQAFNDYIRARDKGKPCISCGRPDDGQHQRHAGHYRAVGAGGGSPVRFHPVNCASQCSQCNVYGGGGLHPGYRPELINRFGLAAVEEVERLHSIPVKWNRAELERLKAEFRAMARAISRSSEG